MDSTTGRPARDETMEYYCPTSISSLTATFVKSSLGAFHHVPHIRTVFNVSREAGLSRRRFSQLFREQVGMTPKLYCRLIRFREVVQQIVAGGPVDWAAVALAGGYFDQAHLAHEFRNFSGLSAGRYLSAERPFVNHVRID